MVLYNQAKGIILSRWGEAYTYDRKVSLSISKAFLLYFPTRIFSDRFPTPIPPYSPTEHGTKIAVRALV